MRIAAALFALAAAAIVAVWGWLGAAVEMPPSPLAPGEKLHCISYAPFRGAQNPFGPDVPIDPRQIEEDLAQLKPFTDCVRTYSIDHGLDQIPEIARRHGMKVLQGLWLSSLPELSRKQIETAIALAKRFPDVIAAVIVGNEVLLRGEMSAPGPRADHPRGQGAGADAGHLCRRLGVLAALSRGRRRGRLRHHPYPAVLGGLSDPGARRGRGTSTRSASRWWRRFPDKEVLIGEFGWPSAGRMREGALAIARQPGARPARGAWRWPSAENYRVNLIEAYDQPWKRQLEGTVGGHWGLFDAYARKAKFAWGGAVSNHPHWRWQAAGGVALAAAVFAAAWMAARRSRGDAAGWLVGAVAANAMVSGTLIGWTIENVPLESLTAGDWIRSLAWTAVALLAPVAAAGGRASAVTIPSFASVLGRRAERPQPAARARARHAAGCAASVLGGAGGAGPRVRSALPRFSVRAADRRASCRFCCSCRPGRAARTCSPAAETVAAAMLALVGGLYCAATKRSPTGRPCGSAPASIVLAVTLLPARDAPG